MGINRSRHRVTRSTVRDRLKAGGQRIRSTVSVAGVAGVALAGSAVLGVTPVLTTAPQLLAQAYYLRGTNIGSVPPDDIYAAFANAVIDQTAGDHVAAEKVPYPGGFWPISKGYFADPTYDASVAQGLASLTTLTNGQTGVIIYGYSQGAVVATEYMRGTGAVGNTYVLVANPNRPNGGILQRFNGVSIPILDITFNGATPTSGDITYDIARQYDGWADFPKYPLNLLATANAVLGIVYLHGKYDQDIDPADLDDPAKTDKTVHNNTTYYLIHTDRLPLLMPFDGILPDAFLDALDAPLRALVELGYDRTNYGIPTTAGLFPQVNPADVSNDLGDAVDKASSIGLGQSPLGTDMAAKTPGAQAALTEPAPTGSRSAVTEFAPKEAPKEHARGMPEDPKDAVDQEVARPTEPESSDGQQPTTVTASNTPGPDDTPTEPVGPSARKLQKSATGQGRSRLSMAAPAGAKAGVKPESGRRSVDGDARTESGHRSGGTHGNGSGRAKADKASSDSES